MYSYKLSLDMLSRLKGIETLNLSRLLKLGVEALDMVSRLKGIETFLVWCVPYQARPAFGYGFPFEGN